MLASSVGLVAYSLFVVALLPAPLAYLWAQSDATGLHLEGVYGILWRGGCSGVVVRDRKVGALSWAFQPAELLRGRLGYRIAIRQGEVEGMALLGARWDGSLALQAEALPLSLLTPFFEGLAVPLQGTMSADLDKLRLDAGRLATVEGVVDWRGATLAFDTPVELGDFRLQLTSGDQGVRGQASDYPHSPLALRGLLKLLVTGAYELDLTLRVRDGDNEDLSTLVRAIGDPDPQGRVHLRLNGRLDS